MEKKGLTILFLLIFISTVFALTFSISNQTASSATANQNFTFSTSITDDESNIVTDADAYVQFNSNLGGDVSNFDGVTIVDVSGAQINFGDDSSPGHYVPFNSSSNGTQIMWNDSESDYVTFQILNTTAVHISYLVGVETGVPTSGSTSMYVYASALPDSVDGIFMTLYDQSGNSLTFQGTTDRQNNNLDSSFQLHEGQMNLINFDLTNPSSNNNGSEFDWASWDGTVELTVQTSSNAVNNTMDLTLDYLQGQSSKYAAFAPLYYNSESQTYDRIQNEGSGNYTYDLLVYKDGFDDGILSNQTLELTNP